MSILLRALLLGVCLLPVAGASAGVAPPLLLAVADDGRAEVSRYLVSEKLDGVRALWDGERLRSRSGREIAAPAWFTAALPKRTLDGELWIARGQFERVSAIVRREQAVDAEWRDVRYMIFELPDAPGSFAERSAEIARLVAASACSWLEQIPQISLVDRKALDRELQRVVDGGGEGLMLHLADAPFMTGRNDVLRKLKPWQDDEATVIGHLPGKGRHAGLLGALQVRLADGRELHLGSGLTLAQRRQPPAIGSVVSYRFRGQTASGLPRFATFWRVREE